MSKETFNRHELKFLIEEATYYELLKVLEPHVEMDSNGDAEGYYTISSIYYDTPDHLFHYEKMSGQVFRQKLRLRTYNHPKLESKSFLEIKKKNSCFVNKRRTVMPLKEAYAFLKAPLEVGAELPFQSSNDQILREAHFLKAFYNLEPKVVVSYERQAFQAKNNPDLRVTFDKNIRKRTSQFRLENGHFGEPYVGDGFYVLEIKVTGQLPLWVVKILSDFRCYMRSFSKYSNSYFPVEDYQNYYRIS